MSLTLDEFDVKIGLLKATRSTLAEKKKSIELEISNFNITTNGMRMPRESYNAFRMTKKKELFEIETQLSRLNLSLDQLHKARDPIWRKEKNTSMNDASMNKIAKLEERLGTALRQNNDLQSRVTQQETEILRLNRQLDAAIREINAIPKTLR